MINAQQTLQTNDFKIGMFGNPGKLHTVAGCAVPVPYDTKYDTGNTLPGNNTTCLNVFSDDGFNMWSYSPSLYTSEQEIKNILTLSQLFDMKVHLGALLYYKPIIDGNGNQTNSGSNVYDNCESSYPGNAITSCQYPVIKNCYRPNYDNYINNIYTNSLYKDIIWGHHIAEEPSYLHINQISNDCSGYNTSIPSNFKEAEVPPSFVKLASDHFKLKLSQAGVTHQKMEIMPANHGKSINDNTIDAETGALASQPNYFNPQDHIKLLNKNDKRDVFFEGSYVSPLGSNWYTQKYNDIFTNGWHILGFLKTIDYAKNYTSEIHDVLTIEAREDSYGQLLSPELHSDATVKNANLLWFQAYSSIIHGAKGIWFFGYNYSYRTCEKVTMLVTNGIPMDTIIAKVRSYYPGNTSMNSITNAQINCNSTSIVTHTVTIVDLVRRATEELLNAIPNQFDRKYFSPYYQNYVSNLAKELAYLKKKDILSTDPSTILYTKTDEADPNCIVPYVTSTNTNYIKTALIAKYGSTFGIPNIPTANYGDLNTEHYGLRYTIRTNGTETYMIISNPLNLPVNVGLNFSSIANPIIKNSTGVEVLFATYANSNPTTTTYKAYINSGTNYRNSTIDLTAMTVGSKYTINYTGNKQLSLSFGPYDVQVLKFISNPLPNYENGWTNTWSNFGSDVIGEHIIKPNDLVYTGDFDGGGDDEILIVNTGASTDKMSMLKFNNGTWTLKWTNTSYSYEHGMFAFRANLIVGDYDGDGDDDLLGNMPLPSGWTTLFRYNNSTNDWNWDWSDNGVSTHPIHLYKGKMYAVDFTGDGKDEILGCDLNTNGFTKEIRWDAASNNFILQGWSDVAGHAIRSYRTNLLPGDYESGGGTELLGLSSWGTLFNYKNGDWNWAWSTGSTGSLGGWTYPLASTDKIVVGDLDGSVDGYQKKDEILFLQTGPSASYATSLDFTYTPTQWNWHWSTNGNPQFIDDWPLGDNGGADTKYYLVRPIASEPKQILAFRNYGCNNSYFASMYKRNNIYANYRDQNKKEEEVTADNSILIFPNPANETVSIKINSEIQSNNISIYDSQGRLIIELLNQKNELSIDLSGFKKGVYIVKVNNITISSIKKLIIQ